MRLFPGLQITKRFDPEMAMLADRHYSRQSGYYCAIFRNETQATSSSLILECEEIVFTEWGNCRMFTYIDPAKVRSANPGYCFKCAGWKFIRRTSDGKHLLAKELD